MVEDQLRSVLRRDTGDVEGQHARMIDGGKPAAKSRRASATLVDFMASPRPGALTRRSSPSRSQTKRIGTNRPRRVAAIAAIRPTSCSWPGSSASVSTKDHGCGDTSAIVASTAFRTSSTRSHTSPQWGLAVLLDETEDHVVHGVGVHQAAGLAAPFEPGDDLLRNGQLADARQAGEEKEEGCCRHRSPQNRPTMVPFLSTSTFMNAGVVPNPGIVRISPSSG